MFNAIETDTDYKLSETSLIGSILIKELEGNHDFSAILKNSLSGLNQTLHRSDELVHKLTAGDVEHIEEVKFQIDEAKKQLQLFLNIRAELFKVLDSIKNMSS